MLSVTAQPALRDGINRWSVGRKRGKREASWPLSTPGVVFNIGMSDSVPTEIEEKSNQKIEP
jgi:hypothetical protein